MQAAAETLTICWSSPASTARCAPIPLPTSTPQMVSLLTRSCFTTPTIKMPESSTLGQRSRMRCWAPLVLAALRCGGSARHKCTCLKNPEVCNELEAIDRNAAAYDRAGTAAPSCTPPRDGDVLGGEADLELLPGRLLAHEVDRELAVDLRPKGRGA